VPSLFYIRLIGFTAGTLVYLFLLALILGHRRPRLFERLLFFVGLSLFLLYAGGLLRANALIQYGTPPPVTQAFYTGLIFIGLATLPGLVVATEVSYARTIQLRRIGGTRWIVLGLFCVLPLRILGVAAAQRESALLLGVALLLIMTPALEFSMAKYAHDHHERDFFRWLGGFSILGCVTILLQRALPVRFAASGDDLLTALVVLGILPGSLLLYYSVRRNFLEFGAQRNLMYALPVTFLALLYLALVRRVSGWLEPVVPPEATAAVLLFSLIFLFEPLERVIGPALQRQFQERMGGVQRLTVELQQEARHGNVAHLVSEAERRVREEYGLAVVRISVPRDATLGTLSAPGGLGHAVTVLLIKDGQEIGVLEAASSGSYLTGETTAALEFLGKQLPGMIDLERLIEDKLRLERELAERERMASLGQMAATVSHNLRNPLSSMKTVLQVQLENPELPVDVRRDCTLVVNEIDRMSAKLSQLLRYAKPSVGGQRVAAVALANQTAVLFRHDAERRNVRIEFERPTEEIFALGSEEALSEILSNLIVNAIEAQTNGGRVKVALALREGRLEIIVQDGGPGISQELRAKIFQPYFTTKPTGTGLGLSIVARRVEEIGGTISCESPARNGKGTRFRLMLPVAEQPPRAEPLR
jgi:signal transduction histidine kinase